MSIGNRNIKPTWKRDQQGLSIVEFMIAVALSLAMVAGAINIMLATKRTYSSTDEHSKVQENGRAALDLLADSLRDAGRLGWMSSSPDRFTVPLSTATCAGVPCIVDDAALANGFTSDAVMVLQYPDADAALGVPADCTGTAVPMAPADVLGVQSPFVTGNRFWVADLDGDGVFSLYCQGFVNAAGGNTPSAAAWVANGNGGPQPLVDGIDSLQVLYGLDNIVEADDTTHGINGFFSSSNIAPATTWQQTTTKFVALRVGLLVNQGWRANGTLDPQARSYQVLDSVAVTTPATDRVLRRVYSTTISFTNSVWAMQYN